MANCRGRRALRPVLLLAAGLLALARAAVGAPAAPRPTVSGLDDWPSVASETVCPAQVRFLSELRVFEAWCAHGVEGLEFEARGHKYVCRTLRLSLPVGDSDKDVAGGCVARLHRVSRSDALSFENDI